MRKLLLTIGAGVVLLAGCKEDNVPIDFGTTSSSGTTYVVSPVPKTDPHQVLVEEFTGQGCPNCPGEHANLDYISAANPGRVNVISLYAAVSVQADPPAGAKNDFRDPVALTIHNDVYSDFDGLPGAGVDRIIPVNGSISQVGIASLGLIDAMIDTQLTTVDPLNVSVSSSYDAAKNIATVVASVTYIQPVSTPQNLSIVVVEDSIIDIQEDGNAAATGGYDNNYLFLDVFRGMVTSAPWGDVLQVKSATPNVKEAGRFFQKTYYYTLPTKSPAIVPAHCRVIAFVNNTNGTDLHVMQSAQCRLAP